jgi:hypothetical protein
MNIRRSLATLTISAAVSASTVGCSAWSAPKSNQGKTWNPTTWFKKEFQEPVQLAAIWKHDVMSDPLQGDQNGFGARIYFYNEKSQAIPIEGDLTIHGFVTTPTSRQRSHEQPEKKFTFSADQLAGQYNPSDLGASYSIWVPWEGDSGFREEITLIATFKSKQGHLIQAAPTKLFLPGKSRFPDDPSMSDKIQPASFQKKSIPTYDLQPAPVQKESTRITTIDIGGNSRLIREPQTVSVGGGNNNRPSSTSAGDNRSTLQGNHSPEYLQPTAMPQQQLHSPQPHHSPGGPGNLFEARSLPPPPPVGKPNGQQ